MKTLTRTAKCIRRVFGLGKEVTNTGTINGTTNNEYIISKIEYSYTQSISSNISTITATLYYRRTNTGYTTGGNWSGSITIGGVKKTGNAYLSIGTSWVKAMSVTQAVTHNSNGSKSVTISGSGSISGASLSVTSCSGTVALTTIPRASKPSIRTHPTTTTNIGTFGDTVTIYTNRKSSSFTHEISYKFSGESGETVIGSSVGASINWKIPDKSALIPAKTTINGTLYCQTKNGSAKIGDRQSIAFTVKINTTEAAPNVGNISVTITDGDTNRIFDESNSSGQYLIKGITSFAARTTPQAKSSATIKGVEGFYSRTTGIKATVSNGTYSFTGGNMASPEQPIGFKVTDSRGLSASASLTLKAISYIKPTCPLTLGAAKIDDSGTKFSFEVTVNGNAYNGSFGNKSNVLSLEYATRETGGNWGAWKAFTANPTLTGNAYTVKQTLTGFDYQKTYDVKVRIKDLVYTSGRESAPSAISAIPPFYWDNKDFYFNAKVHCGELNSDSITTQNLKTSGEVEVYGSTPHIDFHFNNSGDDYTTRIIETASGKLNISAPSGVEINGKKADAESVTLSEYIGSDSKKRLKNLSYTAKYNELLGAVFVRIYATINYDMTAKNDYDILSISSKLPNAAAALSVKCNTPVSAFAKTNGSISIRPLSSNPNSYDINITGFWFV